MSIDRAKALKAAQKYLAKGQIDRAIAEYEKMVQADQGDARSLLKLGDLYTRKGDTRGATSNYRKVALQYAAQGFFLKAVAVFKQILKLDPSDLQAIESLADMYEKLSLASDALATYEQVADAWTRQGKPDKALTALGKLATLDPQNVASWIRYAEALSKANRIDEAADAFRKGADLLKAQGRTDDFVKVTERLLFHSHEDLDRARELSEIYIERGNPKAALTHLQTCFKADPRELRTLSLLARAFAQLGQAVKAVSVYKEVARIHAEAGRTDEEQETLRLLLELDPADADAQKRLSALSMPPRDDSTSFELIDPDDDLDEVVVVEEDASVAAARSAPPLADWERDAQIARLMAECEVFERYGLREKVVAQLQRVLEIDPKQLEAREKLKQAYLKRNQPAQAVTQLRMLAELVAADDPPRARGYLEEALKLAPRDMAVQEQLARIGQTDTRPPSAAPIAEDDEEDLIILDSDEASAAHQAPALSVPGPREHSLATALEGSEEPELTFEDSDDEPELELSEDETGPDVELREQTDPGFELDGEEPEDDVPLIDDSGLDSVLAARPQPAAPAAPVQAFRTQAEAAEEEQEEEAELEIDGGSEEDEEPEIVEALEEADFYLAQGLIDEAREVLFEALLENPKHAGLLAKRRELEALEAAQSAPEPAPVRAPVVEREDKSFAMALKLAGEESEAESSEVQGPVAVDQVLKQFKEGVKRQVDRADTATHYDLGIAYMEMGLHSEAIEEFKLCLDRPEKQCTAQTMIGLSYVAKGEMSLGIEHFKAALASDGCTSEEELGLWFEIGNANELLGKANEALVWYEKVEERNPEFRDVAQRIERLGTVKTAEQEGDEFDAMFDNMIIKE